MMDMVVLFPISTNLLWWGFFIALAIGTYLYAVSTRRRITCNACGEIIKTEHDSVQHCPSCGATLP
jgi:ribosomal protein S27AE